MSTILDPFQSNAVEWLKCKKRGIVVASAGSGKTIIAAAALQAVTLAKPRTVPVKIGWVCNTLEQKSQAARALEQFPIPPELHETRIECAAADADWCDRDVMVWDECHHLPAASWRRQAMSCLGARWGFTATPFGDDPERNEILRDLFDQQILTIHRSQSANRISPARVVMIDESDPGLQQPIDQEIERTMSWRIKYWKGEEWQLRAIVSWHICIKRGIINNQARNAKAIALARQHSGDHVLVLVNEIDHGQQLADQIPKAKLCYSKMGAKCRRETLASFQSGAGSCIVATSLADEGLDLPIANVLILVSGGRSSAKTEQRTGRVLRAFQGKDYGLIYDFLDRQHTLMHNHAKKRMATYQKLGYDIQMP